MNAPYRCNLVIHSEAEIRVIEDELQSRTLGTSLIALCLHSGKRIEVREQLTVFLFYEGSAGIVVMVENNYEKQWAQTKFDGRNNKNLVSSRGEFLVVDSVPPSHRQVIIVLSKCRDEDFSLDYDFTHRLASFEDLCDWAPGCVHLPEFDLECDGLHVPQYVHELF